MAKPVFFGGRLVVQALLIAALSTFMLACELFVDPAGAECAHEATRSAALSAAELEVVQLLTGAGNLEIVGRSRADTIHVRGRACAPSGDLLSQISLRADREGSVAEIETVMPQRTSLDLTVEVPEALAYRVDDSSGDTAIRNVASLDISDGSGDLAIEDIAEEVTIDDGSGSIDIARVGDSVRVVDGSGDLQITDVDSNVRITDGSGDIRVTDVGGDLIIDENGSGRIYFERVEGSVSLP